MWPTSDAAEPGHAVTRRVVLTANLAGALVHYLIQAGELERGGVLLGRRTGETTVIAMAVFPPQLLRERIACSFDVGCLEVLNAAKAMLSEDLTAQLGTIVGWVHSHPRLGIFLSRTDMDTLSSWRQLDPRAVAMVADPYLPGEVSTRIGWWRGPGRGYRVTVDHSGRGHLTIPQVAQVAEALNDSASMDSQWDIVTAHLVASLVAVPPLAVGPAGEPGDEQAPADRAGQPGEAPVLADPAGEPGGAAALAGPAGEPGEAP